jgi:hypothetical protein
LEKILGEIFPAQIETLPAGKGKSSYGKISPNFFRPPDSPGEMPAEEATTESPGSAGCSPQQQAMWIIFSRRPLNLFFLYFSRVESLLSISMFWYFRTIHNLHSYWTTIPSSWLAALSAEWLKFLASY